LGNDLTSSDFPPLRPTTIDDLWEDIADEQPNKKASSSNNNKSI
jgi:hypothetical protein